MTASPKKRPSRKPRDGEVTLREQRIWIRDPFDDLSTAGEWSKAVADEIHDYPWDGRIVGVDIVVRVRPVGRRRKP